MTSAAQGYDQCHLCKHCADITCRVVTFCARCVMMCCAVMSCAQWCGVLCVCVQSTALLCSVGVAAALASQAGHQRLLPDKRARRKPSWLDNTIHPRHSQHPAASEVNYSLFLPSPSPLLPNVGGVINFINAAKRQMTGDDVSS